VEDEAVERPSGIHSDNQMSEPAIESREEVRANGAVPPDAARRRVSVLLAALTILGGAIEYPLALALKSLDRSELLRATPFLAITLVLAALIPLALKLNGSLGLPGAPLIAAKCAGENHYFSIRSLIKISLGYALLAAVTGATVLGIVLLPLLLIKHGGLALPNSPMLTVPPARIAIVGALVAIAAAISEEIQFRLVLYSVLGWVAAMISRDSRGHPGRVALWIVTLAQGYAFGMVHLVPLASPFFRSTSRLMLAGLVMPQTWEGVVFGRLYLRRGVEASIIAHASMDLALFVFAAIGVLQSHLGPK
jgi:membrane protease YdiL (CAAX protease family)